METSNFNELNEYISKLDNKEEYLIHILRKAQEIFGSIPKEIQIYIHNKTGIPLSKIYGVSTFYPFFNLTLKETELSPQEIQEVKSPILNNNPKQTKNILKICEQVNPEDIKSYIELGGYGGLRKALNMTHLQILDELEISKLRGRGGAGFPVWKKWEDVYKQISSEKYVICNGNESESYSFKDFYLLYNSPQIIIEGLIIAGYTVRANKGFIFIRSNYAGILNRLELALKQARESNFLGENIMGTGFSFDIEIRFGAGAYVSGEETALIQSLTGNRGEPSQKPPYIFQKGYKGKPTVLNNVETLANIPYLLINGGENYSKIGTNTSTGTKIITLLGNVKIPGIVEVPMGITIKELIEDIGGGTASGEPIKGIQSDGTVGQFIMEKNFDRKVEIDNMVNIKSFIGFNGIKVLDKNDSIVTAVKDSVEFLMNASCGKCTPCRIGNRRIYELLEKLLDGHGTMSDIDMIKEISTSMKLGSICGLGKSIQIPIITAMDEFWDEFETKTIDNKIIPPNSLIHNFYDINDKCIGCGACSLVCPVLCIEGHIREKYKIDHFRCIKCNKCYEVCNFEAIDRS